MNRPVHLATAFAACVLAGIVTAPLYVTSSPPAGRRTVDVVRVPITRSAPAPTTPPAPPRPAGGEYPG